MPVSAAGIRRPILRSISRIISSNDLSKAEILDLGIGRGDYGKLIRRKIRAPASITGVEIWEKYRNHRWSCYDKIIIGDIRDYLAESEEKSDIVLLIDVIEHLGKAEGEEALQHAVDLARKACIVSTPITSYSQKPYRGNPYEEHKSAWTHKEIAGKGFRRISSMWMPIIPTTIWPPIVWPFIARIGVYLLEK